jgi:hypothetical protein
MRIARYLISFQHRPTFLGIAASLMLAGLLLACRSSKHPAAAAVETYLQALVNKDESRLTAATCKAFEADALLELDSYGLVKTRLDGLQCQAQDTGSTTADVTCQGKIIATYGAEDQQFDLSGRTYKVQKEGGDWLICGQ